MKSKTPQEIFEEFKKFDLRLKTETEDIGSFVDFDVVNNWLRSSMQSLLLHVMGEMPKRDGDMFPGISAVADGEELARARQRGMEYGYDLAITDCLAVIQSTIDSIKE